MKDRVIDSIESLIDTIEGKTIEEKPSSISSREEIINVHYAFLKTMLLFPEKKV